MHETYGDDRRKATDEMRERAKWLEKDAQQWRALANALDNIERYSAQVAQEDEESPAPHIGVGSDAELLLWRLATAPREKP